MIHDLSDSSAAPASFGPFRVLHQIGVGVLGPVYRAQDSVRDQLVAVKAFKVDAPPEQAEDIADALRDVAHALPRHRGLLEYIASGVERSTPYLVMAHSDVPSLDTRLKPGIPLDAEEALDLIATLADAIDAAHAKGIVHGVLHPRDVFVDDRGGCRISGFGVAKALMGAGIRTVPVRRPYSPPERVVGGTIERSADLFALGALAFELFSGRRVVGYGLDAAVRCAVSAPDVDVERLRTALAAMLAENPVHRPSSATAFAQAVTQAVRPRGLTPEAGRRRVTPNEIKMSALGAGAGAAAAAAASATGAAAARATEPGLQGGSAEGEHSGSRAPETVKLNLEDVGASDGPHERAADAPESDALEIFTRQGTVWEATSPPPDTVRLETVTVAPDEDPLAQFSSEAESGASSAASSAPTVPMTSAVSASAVAASAAAAAAAAASAPTVPLGPAFTTPATPTQPIAPIAIDDDSTEEEVQSIADAARAISVRSASASSTESERPTGERRHEHETEPEVQTEHFEYLPIAATHAAPHTSDFDARATAASASAADRAAASILTDRDHRDHTREHTHDHDRVLTDLRGWSPAEEPEPAESRSNPFRVLAMVLAIGLAVGVAGGYLLGQRSALRQAFALFGGGGGQTEQPSTDQAAPPSGNPTASTPPATSAGSGSSAPTVVSEPTVVPEGSQSQSARAQKPTKPTEAAKKNEPPPRDASSRPQQRNTPAAAAASVASAAPNPAPTKGSLVVKSSPARAEVTVNGIRKGETPVTLRDLPFGTHTIQVTRSGYLSATRKVTLSASRNADAIDFDLEPEGRYTRTSNAGGAGAAGDRVGGGIVAAGGEPDLEHASAEATAAGLGSLYVLSHPAGARVMVDGQYVGSTPLLVTNVPPGTKTIKLELPGHKAWSSSVRVSAGQRVRVAASLEEGTN